MNIVIIGSTGFVGNSMVEKLSKLHKVYQISRSGLVSEKSFNADISDRESLEKLVLPKIDLVINCIGISPITYHKDEIYESVHCIGVRNLLSFMKAKSISRIIQISAIGADSNSPFRYLSTKGKAERLIKESGLGYTIIRPSHILGPDNEFERLIKKLSIFNLSVIPKIGNNFHPIYIGDLVAIVSDIITEASVDRVIEVGGPRILPLYKLIIKNASLLGIKMHSIPLPKSLNKILIKLFEALRIVNKHLSEYIWTDNIAESDDSIITTTDYLRLD